MAHIPWGGVSYGHQTKNSRCQVQKHCYTSDNNEVMLLVFVMMLNMVIQVWAHLLFLNTLKTNVTNDYSNN